MNNFTKLLVNSNISKKIMSKIKNSGILNVKGIKR